MKRHHTLRVGILAAMAMGLLSGCAAYGSAMGTKLTYPAEEHMAAQPPGLQLSVDKTNKITASGPASAKSPEETAESESQEPAGLTMLFAGDILLSDHVLNAYDRAGGIHGVLNQGFLDQINSADIFMANQEFPFSTRGQSAEDKEFTFRLNPSRVKMMQELQVDIVSLANNHILDFGVDALLDTCDTLDQAGLLHVGAGAGLDEAKRLETINVDDKTIGFLGASRVFPVAGWAAGKNHPGALTAYDSTVLIREIKAARKVCDYVVVYVHWGIERDEAPQEYQRTMGKAYIDAGADLVIGSHPHVLQGIEYYNGKPIVYSLGNFIFGSSIPKTMLLEVKWDGADTVLTLVPGTSSAGYTRSLNAWDSLQEFYAYMEEISFGITIDEDGTVSN